MSTSARTAVDAVINGISNDPSRPRLTTYDPAGNRTELSGTALLNWAAKVAGLLIDELGASPDDTVCVQLSPGWQAAGILIGSWWAGMTVTYADDAAAIAAFVADGADASSDEVFVVSGHPLGAPSRQVATHQRDFTGAVLGQADRFSPRWTVAADAIAITPDLTVGTFQQWLATDATHSATDRLLTTGGWAAFDGRPGGQHQGGELFHALLLPLARGASVIHIADNPDASALRARAQSEGITGTYGVALTGLPHLDFMA